MESEPRIEPSLMQPIFRPAHEGSWVSWLGAPAQFLLLGEESSNGSCLSRATSPVGGSAPPHRHDFEEGFYLLSGQLTFRAGNQTYRLEAGDFINVGSGVVHSVKNESDRPAETLILCSPAGFDRFQLEGGYPMPGPDGPLVPFDDAGKERVLRAAARYNIEMNPPESAFQLPPKATVTRSDQGTTVDAVGDRYRFLVTGRESEGKYALWEALLSPGGGPPPHTHSREEEGFIVLDGRVRFFSEGAEFEAQPGDVVHLPRGRSHRFQNHTDKPARLLI